MKCERVKTGLLLVLLVTQCWCGAGECLGAKSTRAGLEKAVKRSPGNLELRCELIGVLLTEGDTVAAEQQLDYAQKLSDGSCLRIHRAQVALNRGKVNDAAGHCAVAVKNGLMPQDEPLIFRVDSLSGGVVTTRLKMTTRKDKADVNSPAGLGQLLLQQGDTTDAVAYLREAYRRGDTTLRALIDSLAGIVIPVAEDSSQVMTIAFVRNLGKIELNCKLNGLKIKAELDTVAKESSISGVETTFMLKNNFATREDVVDNMTLMIREIDFGEGLVLRDVRLHYRKTQESPVIFCLDDLRRLGEVRINEEKKVLEIVRRQHKNHTTITQE